MKGRLLKKDLIPTYEELVDDIKSLLVENSVLAALYINCSKINKIEKLFGKKIYSDVLKQVKMRILDMRGEEIRHNDIIVSYTLEGDEFIVFLAKKREDRGFYPTDLESLCYRVTDHLNKSIFPITFPYLRGRPRIVIGHAVVLYNPLIREERLINKLIEDARLMSNYQEFKRLIRNKEKVQELIMKEEIRTVFQPIVSFKDKEIIGYEALSRGPEGTEYENPYLLLGKMKKEKISIINLIFRYENLFIKHKSCYW